MMHAPFARHLARFPTAAVDEPPRFEEPARRHLEAVPSEPTITLSVSEYEARVRDARDNALEALRADHQAAIEACTLAHLEALATIREAVAAEVRAEHGRLSAEDLESAFTGLRDAVSTDLAGALRPLFTEAAATRMVGALVGALEAALCDGAHPVVTLRGPAGRLAAIQAAMGERSAMVFSPDDGAEVRISADGWHAGTRFVETLALLGDA